MGRLGARQHELLLQGGFRYDEARDRYFLRGEAAWAVQRRIERGRRQLGVPARTPEEFFKGERQMVEELLARLRSRAAAEGRPTPRGAGGEGEGQQPLRAAKRSGAGAEPAEAAAAEAVEGELPQGGARKRLRRGEQEAGAEGAMLEDFAQEELGLLRKQAVRLRSTIARRRAIPGCSCSSDNVVAIVAHYEVVLAELESRIQLLAASRGQGAGS